MRKADKNRKQVWVPVEVHAELLKRKHKGQTVAGYIQEMLDREKERDGKRS